MNEPKRGSAVKGWLVTGATALFVVGAVYAFTRVNAEEPSRGGEVPLADGGAPGVGADGGSSLRDELLRSTAATLGIKPMRHVWGVLMERGYAKGAATIVGLADGTASLYISTGGSVTGAQAYAPARLAAMRLCDSGADALGDALPVNEFPAPAKGRVRYYILAEDGVRVLEGDLGGHAADGGDDLRLSRLAPLNEAGEALLTAIKEATSKGLIR